MVRFIGIVALLFFAIIAGIFINSSSVDSITGGTVDMSEPIKVLMKTSMGDIELELYPKSAPITVDNFIKYVNSGTYAGTVFHRVISGFMIQGGGFTSDGTQKPVRAPIKLESNNGLSNERGSIAMARTYVANSATDQFFINVVDNDFLDYGSRDEGYAVFGKVINGMDVVDKISKVTTTTKSGMSDWPVKDVLIKEVVILK